ncbi:MAG: hypothetical protein Q8P86_02395, partial [bacterium]|nr:hypothetical protein [bacterium]
MKKTLTAFGLLSFLALPLVSLAQDFSRTPFTVEGAGTIGEFLDGLNALINIIFPFIVGLAVLVVVFGIFSFIVAGADEEKRKGAKGYIIWGVIGIFLMISIWGLVAILN